MGSVSLRFRSLCKADRPLNLVRAAMPQVQEPDRQEPSQLARDLKETRDAIQRFSEIEDGRRLTPVEKDGQADALYKRGQLMVDAILGVRDNTLPWDISVRHELYQDHDIVVVESQDPEGNSPIVFKSPADRLTRERVIEEPHQILEILEPKPAPSTQ